MNIIRYVEVIYSLIVWSFALIFIKPRRIKELLPVGILSAIILFFSFTFLISLQVYKFNFAMLWIYDIPVFFLVWGFGSGIIYIHYLKKHFNWQFPITLLFTAVTLLLEFFAEKLGVATHLGSFTELHEAYLDFLSLAALLWISNGLWGNTIFGKTK
jgi:hypothetical protein